jgi:hypothetical protein
MVVLYNRLAEMCCFTAAAWQELLVLASRYGWKPRGSAPPPSQFNLDVVEAVRNSWDGNYSRPRSQTVLPEDANAMSRAVAHALASGARWKVNDEKTLREFTLFCQERGFVVSSTLFKNAAANGPFRTTSVL